ncbi:MAG: hypothetical protein OER77_04965 [Myxococcales bacterium]|nr:hypothetical protein [Myxococcales bacterium]
MRARVKERLRYANLLNYTHWIEFETKLVLKVEDAVPIISAYLG